MQLSVLYKVLIQTLNFGFDLIKPLQGLSHTHSKYTHTNVVFLNDVTFKFTVKFMVLGRCFYPKQVTVTSALKSYQCDVLLLSSKVYNKQCSGCIL